MASKTKKMPSEPEVSSADSPSSRILGYNRTLIAIVATSLIVIMAVIGSLVVYYQNRALPNTMLGNMQVGGKTKDEIYTIAKDQSQLITLTLENGDKKVAATLADLGVNINIDQTVDDAINTRRNWLDIVLAWQPKVVPLAYTSDLGMAKVFAKDHFPDVVSDAQDAQLVFNNTSKRFDIKPGSPGKGFDVVGFVQALERLVADPRPVILPVTTMPVQPVVQESKLEPVQATANQAAALSIKFTYNGKVMYTADPRDIAAWAHFVPEPTKNSFGIEYDLAAIRQFLTQKVGPSITAPAVDKKVVRDTKTGKEIVVQSGREGRQLADIDSLAAEVLKALQESKPFEKEVAITTAPFKTVTLTGSDHWVEVDLSEQKTYLYLGSDRVAAFTISSGIAKYPTVTGEFAVRAKVLKQTMTGGSRATGDYYYTPNITWVSYFHKDYAFHTAYWHNNFGNPMSHGCINMRAADAKALYDFAPIGTRVIVHN